MLRKQRSRGSRIAIAKLLCWRPVDIADHPHKDDVCWVAGNCREKYGLAVCPYPRSRSDSRPPAAPAIDPATPSFQMATCPGGPLSANHSFTVSYTLNLVKLYVLWYQEGKCVGELAVPSDSLRMKSDLHLTQQTCCQTRVCSLLDA